MKKHARKESATIKPLIVPFSIEKIDNRGQGISYSEEGPLFIPKALPQESGMAVITGAKKGVRFAEISGLHPLQNPSPKRVEPFCPHFADCPSCHYQHLSYEDEIDFKQQALRSHLRKMIKTTTWLQMHKAKERFAYRNRVQLHYDLSKKLLGAQKKGQILPIPECLLPEEKLLKAYRQLYLNDSWMTLVKNNNAPNRGHIELYHKERDSDVSITLNAPYSHGGFTQVNEAMNKVLQNVVQTTLSKQLDLSKPYLAIDLFGGNGNLSLKLDKAQVLVVDYYTKAPSLQASHQQYLSLNLYAKAAPLELIKALKAKALDQKLELLMLDPPRSGLKNIDQFCQALKPNNILYVSCDPATMARDLEKLQSDYELQEVHLIDLFPSTFHFETMAFLSRRITDA